MPNGWMSYCRSTDEWTSWRRDQGTRVNCHDQDSDYGQELNQYPLPVEARMCEHNHQGIPYRLLGLSLGGHLYTAKNTNRMLYLAKYKESIIDHLPGGNSQCFYTILMHPSLISCHSVLVMLVRMRC